ncbi:hypothetical protein, partial [Acetobacter thailandicus]|uniref:hypothetical protein n=1 Tax=Acetobacter thailandicus TaxID=1502842 RepID=UPI001BA8D255
KTVNQIAKTQKLLAKHINQGFFDLFICRSVSVLSFFIGRRSPQPNHIHQRTKCSDFKPPEQ